MLNSITINIKLNFGIINRLLEYLHKNVYGNGDIFYCIDHKFDPFMEQLMKETYHLFDIIVIVCDHVYDSMDYPDNNVCKYIIDILKIIIDYEDINKELYSFVSIPTKYVEKSSIINIINYNFYSSCYGVDYFIKFDKK